MAATESTTEFTRQEQNLLAKGYPKLAGMTEKKFLGLLAPLRKKLGRLKPPAAKSERIPCVIVIREELVRADAAMRKVRIKGRQGHVAMQPVTPVAFQPLPGLKVPEASAYLLLDIETGRRSLNVTVARALPAIRRRKRSPLTIDEGVALLTHFPEILTDKERYNCVWLAGSRGSDKRVPALWSSYGRPRLGWCWENTPHTWLGCASCGGRTGSGK